MINNHKLLELILTFNILIFILVSALGFVVIKAHEDIIGEIKRRAKRNTQLNSPSLKNKREEGARLPSWDNGSINERDLSSHDGEFK